MKVSLGRMPGMVQFTSTESPTSGSNVMFFTDDGRARATVGVVVEKSVPVDPWSLERVIAAMTKPAIINKTAAVAMAAGIVGGYVSEIDPKLAASLKRKTDK